MLLRPGWLVYHRNDHYQQQQHHAYVFQCFAHALWRLYIISKNWHELVSDEVFFIWCFVCFNSWLTIVTGSGYFSWMWTRQEQELSFGNWHYSLRIPSGNKENCKSDSISIFWENNVSSTFRHFFSCCSFSAARFLQTVNLDYVTINMDCVNEEWTFPFPKPGPKFLPQRPPSVANSIRTYVYVQYVCIRMLVNYEDLAGSDSSNVICIHEHIYEHYYIFVWLFGDVWSEMLSIPFFFFIRPGSLTANAPWKYPMPKGSAGSSTLTRGG